MAMLRRFLAIFAWKTEFVAGVYAYQENRVTGRRRVRRVIDGGYSSLDVEWLQAGSSFWVYQGQP
jgi:hypothetical protein